MAGPAAAAGDTGVGDGRAGMMSLRLVYASEAFPRETSSTSTARSAAVLAAEGRLRSFAGGPPAPARERRRRTEEVGEGSGWGLREPILEDRLVGDGDGGGGGGRCCTSAEKQEAVEGG